jgi:hypothetical protein
VSRQGGVDEGPIDGIDDAINSTVSTAALVLGGKETGEESTEKRCISIRGLQMSEQETPKVRSANLSRYTVRLGTWGRTLLWQSLYRRVDAQQKERSILVVGPRMP